MIITQQGNSHQFLRFFFECSNRVKRWTVKDDESADAEIGKQLHEAFRLEGWSVFIARVVVVVVTAQADEG